MSGSQIKLFSANANPELAQEIAEYLGLSMASAKVIRFSDGEVTVDIDESVRGADVFIIQPTCAPVNEHLMELLIMIDAVRRASARRITAVIPYYGYARQERKSRAREPISAKLVANLLTAAGARRVVAMDLHASAIQGFFDIPVDHLPGVPILAEYYQKKHLDNLLVVSPDLGGVTRARNLANRLGTEIAIIDKRRPQPNVAEIMNIIGDIRGKTVVMADDIIDTAGTITLGAQALLDRGAKEVHACCTHAVLSGSAYERLEKSVIKEVLITNTIPFDSAKAASCSKIKVLSVAPIFGEAIMRIHEDLSVSRLFD
ncbi:ribose-phosphate pyrophosphokinase [Dehalobacterium formicoaceticum]|uniref:Ribose-phosphate pyrophosphokinase n=1 Tax=Dehalobacterium formicoaceticum TaxID=51515 RepID=A0ABT1Y388_9FIRM|nr:ribose-phosphate pyrophosphokinase [Dehalobacterium formicoaceticum]MCR6545345.1 ribose-phosphate pyrophosphokinase [Dehalobacterium formicoaceticum]